MQRKALKCHTRHDPDEYATTPRSHCSAYHFPSHLPTFPPSHLPTHPVHASLGGGALTCSPTLPILAPTSPGRPPPQRLGCLTIESAKRLQPGSRIDRARWSRRHGGWLSFPLPPSLLPTLIHFGFGVGSDPRAARNAKGSGETAGSGVKKGRSCVEGRHWDTCQSSRLSGPSVFLRPCSWGATDGCDTSRCGPREADGMGNSLTIPLACVCT